MYVSVNSMKNFERIHEIAIFSIKNFLFAIDTFQIQEIVTLKNPEFLAEPDEENGFFFLRHKNAPIPILNLYKKFQIPLSSSQITDLFSIITFVTFYHSSKLIACWVDRVKNITPVSLRSLKSVPHIITKTAQNISIWGFYEIPEEFSGRAVPLLDLSHIVTEQDIAEYTASLSTIQ